MVSRRREPGALRGAAPLFFAGRAALPRTDPPGGGP